jgi:D-glycero-alpha-D-manno-heptose-7-phosphate kinase
VTNPQRTYKARAPLRISFFGGGTDVDPYSEEYGGVVLNATINQYVHCMLRPSDEPTAIIRSLDLEEISRRVTGKVWDGKLDLAQAVISDVAEDTGGVEILMYSDVPPGSGLGSSSTLVVCMLAVLHARLGSTIPPDALAEQAYKIERVDLGIPGGRQDQYAAAHGGINIIRFGPGPIRQVEPLALDRAITLELESGLTLAYTGARNFLAERVITDQVERVKQGETLRHYESLKRMTWEAVDLLRTARVDDFGRLLHEEWQLKKALSPRISSPEIDEIYDSTRRRGALGGKLSGAGGGGFMFFYSPFDAKLALQKHLVDRGLEVVPLALVHEGVHWWSLD